MRRSLMATTLLSALLLPQVAAAQPPMHDEHGHVCDPHAPPEPILSVPDFDGDGTVLLPDLLLLLTQMWTGDYVAFFDVDADGRLDGRDLKATACALHRHSTLLDRQLADLYWATEMYRDKQNAIEAGFRPFTQTLAGHGDHYARLPFLVTAGGIDPSYQNNLDGTVVITDPEGLNYDENGELVAVFYYHGVDIFLWVLDQDPAVQAALFQQSILITLQSMMSPGHLWPPLFDSAGAMWHHHFGPCWDDLDYAAMAVDPTHTPYFVQPQTPEECAARAISPGSRQGWIPGFNMIHVWLYKLNPCGLFAGTHPHMAEGYEEEPMLYSVEEWFMKMGLPMPMAGP